MPKGLAEYEIRAAEELEAITAKRYGPVVGQPAGTIQREVWRVLVAKDGRSLERAVLAESRRVMDVVKDLAQQLRTYEPTLMAELDRFGPSVQLQYQKKDMVWPTNCTVACFGVTGSSEGYYAEVGVIIPHDNGPTEYVNIATGKTFSGMAIAQTVAAACAKALEA
jgi:hypothetical protein